MFFSFIIQKVLTFPGLSVFVGVAVNMNGDFFAQKNLFVFVADSTDMVVCGVGNFGRDLS